MEILTWRFLPWYVQCLISDALTYMAMMSLIMNHLAVGPMLQKPGVSGKHAKWWLEVHGSRIQNIIIRCERIVVQMFSLETS